MTDEAAFQRSIIASGPDVVPRLIFADWLEEQGRSNEDDVYQRANFIRHPIGHPGTSTRTKRHRQHLALIKNTIADLLPKTYRVRLLDPDQHSGQFLADSMPEEPVAPLSDIGLLVRHGYIEAISLNQGLFARIVGQLFERHPIRDVCLTRQIPNDMSIGAEQRFGWIQTSYILGSWWEDCIYQPIFERLDGGDTFGVVDQNEPGWQVLQCLAYPSWLDAHRALSAACVRWGRELAGL